MSFSNTTENDILQLLFNKVALSWDANNTLYVALHTATPDETGVQTANECAYGSYDRVAVTRNGSGGWTVTGNAITNASLIQFPQCTSSTETVTHVSIGLTDHPTGGQIIAYGALSASLSVSSGIQPQFSAGELDLTLN
jgi:hypothetical protein